MENHELLTADFFGPTTIPGLLPNSSFDEWQGMVAYALKYFKGINWLLADCLNHRWADTDEGLSAMEQMIELAGLGKTLKPQTRLNIKSVGKKFPPEVRNKGYFTYYQEAQALPLPDALEVIEKADNAKDIREAVRAVKGGSAGARSAATVISEEEDLPNLRIKLRIHLDDLRPVLEDDEMTLDNIRLATKPLYQALKDLLR